MSDTDEIRRTLALYSRFNDEKDSTAWSQLWTENGAITDRSGTYVGRPAIKRFLDALNEANPDRDMLHFCANSVIALEGDTALAHTDIVFVSRSASPSASWATGSINHYTDRLARSGSTWLFEDRRIDPRPNVRTPLAELRLGPPPSDHEAIRYALALYAQLLDSKDATGWSAQFASTATLHTRSGEISGRSALERHLQREFADEPAGRNTAHLCVNPVIVVDGHSARVSSDWLRFEKLGDEPWTVANVSRANDRLTREDGAWRFVSKAA